MSSVVSVPRASCAQMDRARVDARLSGCACLPSLSSVDSALRELLVADQSYTSQIAEIIRRDPSLAARLLHMVNAIHYGSAKAPTNIDDAVFYLGVRQIRQLAMLTQIIEDFQKVAQGQSFPWREFWRHSIATALMTREIINLRQTRADEIDYVAGLLHDVGKIVMASAFPDHFLEIHHRRAEAGVELMSLEREVLGVDHAELGAMFLRRQRLPEVYVHIVQFHHAPQLSRYHSEIAAAVSLSDLLVRHAKIGHSGNLAEVPPDSWVDSPAWKILFPQQTEMERCFLRTGLQESLQRIPAVLESLI